jgi:cysteine desulfurase
MAANNEVGTIYPSRQIAEMARDAGALTLVDATQAAGRVPIAARDWGISYLALSAHKMYGPKGVGALLTPPSIKIYSSHGTIKGVPEGTPNVPGIVGLGEACRLRMLEMSDDEQRIARQRDRLETILCQTVQGLIVNGHRETRLSHNLHVSVPSVPNDAVVARLHRRVAISTGAACSSGAQEPSHVLRAMGLAPALQEGALRIGLGKFTTDSEVEQAGVEISDAIRMTRDALVGSRT